MLIFGELTKGQEPVFLYATVRNGMRTVLKIQNKAPSLEQTYIAKPVARSDIKYYLKYMVFIILNIKKPIVNVSKLQIIFTCKD